jgi:hypothetical protein
MVARLVGRLVLVVEDEPLVALDVADCLKAAGAQVIIARTLADALRESASANLSAAVLDHGQGGRASAQAREPATACNHACRGSCSTPYRELTRGNHLQAAARLGWDFFAGDSRCASFSA